jgi:hypothetical protein
MGELPMTNDATPLVDTNLLIGIDDTDSVEGGGTGSVARNLLASFDERRIGAALGATRHQLLLDPSIPYTSENASHCIALKASHSLEVGAIAEAVAEFVQAEAAPGASPGIAIVRDASWEDPDITSRLVAFGQSAKTEVLDPETAILLGGDLGIHVSGHGATNRGVVGALAGVGLHLSGSDGLFSWMPGLDDVAGQVTYRQLRFQVPIDAALDSAGREPGLEDVIDVGDWVRPVLRGGRSILLLDPPVSSTAEAGGFGARPRTVTKWQVSGRAVVLKR